MKKSVYVFVWALISCEGVKDDDGLNLFFAPIISDGECSESPAGSHGLPIDIGWLVVRVIDNEGNEVSSFQGGNEAVQSGQVILKGLKPGEYRVEVIGCLYANEMAKATWIGERSNVTVLEHSKVSPVIFMRKIGGLSCIGGENKNKTAPGFDGADFLQQGFSAFGSLAIVGNRVFLTGGFDSRKPAGTSDELFASKRIFEYFPEKGVFVPLRNKNGNVLSLNQARGLHQSFSSGDDKLILVGGAQGIMMAPKSSSTLISPPPLMPVKGVDSLLEIIDISQEKVIPIQSINYTGLIPTIGFGKTANKHWIVVMGGLDKQGVGGMPIDDILIIESNAERIMKEDAVFVSGHLNVRRFGGVVQFLSSGDILLVGGTSDHKNPSPPELVMFGGDSSLASVILFENSWPSSNFYGTAFPSVAIVKDDGSQAEILVVGGNPIDPSIEGYRMPENPNAWILKIKKGSDKHYDPSTAEVELVKGFEIWAHRTLASLVPFKDTWLLIGGMRDFQPNNKIPECKESSNQICPFCSDSWGGFCFFQTIDEFKLIGNQATYVGVYKESKSRFGSAITLLGNKEAIIFGGLAGFGNPPKEKNNILNDGVILKGRGVEDDICASHSALKNL